MPSPEQRPEEETPVHQQARSGQYAAHPPESDEGRPPAIERLKDLLAMTLAALSLLWKPLLCAIAGLLGAALLMRLFLS